MDIHPLVVHFPIALLVIYSLLEVAALRPRFRTSQRTHAKLLLLFIGTLWALAALSTWETAAHLSGIRSLTLWLHEWAASTTTGIYKFLAIFYLVELALQYSTFTRLISVPKLLEMCTKLIRFIKHFRLPAIAALLWFFGLNLVGALGGTLVYGPDADPITSALNQVIQQLDARYDLSSLMHKSSE